MLKRLVAVVPALDRLAYLVIGEFEFRSHLHAAFLGAFPGGTAIRPDVSRLRRSRFLNRYRRTAERGDPGRCDVYFQ